MNIFDVLIIQPIFNALLFIYGILPGHDFGISIIIFTVLVRLALWPLVKKQLHQTKLMRKVQPELKKIKARTKGNKKLETQLMMELYKERGVKPFSSIGVLIIQLPIFIALYRVILIITRQRDQIGSFVYDGVNNIPAVHQLTNNPHVAESFLGFVDLTKNGFSGGGIYIPLVFLAAIAAIFQFIQTKQLSPQTASKMKLRDILKESSSGKKVDQSEITAAITGKMTKVLPAALFVFALFLPAAVVLYYATSNLVAVIQQHIIFGQDEEEIVEIADKPLETKSKNGELTVRIKKAKQAQTVSKKKHKKRKRK